MGAPTDDSFGLHGVDALIMASGLANARPKASRVPAVMLSRVTGPLESLLACGIARRSSPDVIELFLDEDEAEQGGMVTIAMQVDVRCPECNDGARTAPCSHCAGTHTVTERFSAWLAVPPSVPEGHVLLPSVELPGMIRRPQFRVRRQM